MTLVEIGAPVAGSSDADAAQRSGDVRASYMPTTTGVVSRLKRRPRIRRPGSTGVVQRRAPVAPANFATPMSVTAAEDAAARADVAVRVDRDPAGGRASPGAPRHRGDPRMRRRHEPERHETRRHRSRHCSPLNGGSVRRRLNCAMDGAVERRTTLGRGAVRSPRRFASESLLPGLQPFFVFTTCSSVNAS